MPLRSVVDILESVKNGTIDVPDAEKLLRLDSIAILGDLARIDTGRYLRRGVPEIVYAASKTDDQLSKIILGLLDIRYQQSNSRGGKTHQESFPIIVSRLRDTKQTRVVESALNSFNRKRKTRFKSSYYEDSRILIVSQSQAQGEKSLFKDGPPSNRVALLSAGTSDGAALSEAETILKVLGCRTIRFNDVGVAAIHRLKGPLRKIVRFDPDAIVVAAGMEGALPSLIAGLSSVPVIGLPTSVGYGYGKDGESALMGMLQACPLGMCVVNIDAGVAAGIVAYLIARRASTKRH